jgi:hypothetical protein
MADDPDRTREQKPRQPNPALKALKIMFVEWDLQGRDFTSGEEIWQRAWHPGPLPLRSLSANRHYLGLLWMPVNSYPADWN